MQVCTACMIVSLLTTYLNLNTPPLAQVAPFRCKIRESNAEVTLDTKLSKHGQSDHHGSCASTAWSQQSVCSLYHPRARQSPTWRQSVHKNSYCLLLLLCSCFAHCSWFHSVCAPVSMFTITGTCLFLFLFLFLFLGRHQNTTKAFVQTSRPLHLHRSKPLRVHTKSVCVRTRSAYLLRAVHIQSLQTLRQIHQWLVTII